VHPYSEFWTNMTQLRSNALICLGGNQESAAGQPAQTLVSALLNMPREGLRIRAVSRFYATPSFPDKSAPEFVNAAVSVETLLSPSEILGVLHQIEQRFGRHRDQRWGQRTLDLDLISVGQDIIPDRAIYDSWRGLPPSRQAQVAPGQLILPHPRLQDRAFVLVPLADIAPDWRHPVLGQSVAAMCARLPRADVAEVRPI
jgi:2-amino-4-hydroxy-6-hydroxymethyldihydropteridine diphosphokinase